MGIFDNIWNKISDFFSDSLTYVIDSVISVGDEVSRILALEFASWDSLVSLSEVFKPFCYTIISLCLLIELANTASRVDIIKWEHGLKLAIKMVLAKVAIDIAPDFLEACYRQSVSWVTAIDINALGGLGDHTEIKVNFLESVNLIEAEATLSYFPIILIIIIICYGASWYARALAYGRMFELYVYLVLSPIPFAFFPMSSEGGMMSRITTKFCKTFIATCLQSVTMIVCIMVYGKIMAYMFGNLSNDMLIFESMGYLLLGTVVMIAGMSKSGAWSKALIDAL